MQLPDNRSTEDFGKIPPIGTSTRVPSKVWDEVFSFAKTVVTLVILAAMLNGTVIQAFKIPSESMKPTLLIGDHLLASKLSYGIRLPFLSESIYPFAIPHRGDVIIFTRVDDPSTSEDESSINLIKRVIGLPGDRIELRGTKMYINNELLDEPYAKYIEGGIREGNFGPETVPENHVFVMGDNRDHSKDSRFWNPSHSSDPYINYVDVKRIKGRALFIYWSWDTPARIGTIIR
jgi:signal peptidase I